MPQQFSEESVSFISTNGIGTMDSHSKSEQANKQVEVQARGLTTLSQRSNESKRQDKESQYWNDSLGNSSCSQRHCHPNNIISLHPLWNAESTRKVSFSRLRLLPHALRNYNGGSTIFFREISNSWFWRYGMPMAKKGHSSGPWNLLLRATPALPLQWAKAKINLGQV